MSSKIPVKGIVRFHQVAIGQKFQRDTGQRVYVKSSKGGAHHDGAYHRINSQALCLITIKDDVA